MALKKYFFKLLGIENCKEKILLEEKFDENFNEETQKSLYFLAFSSVNYIYCLLLSLVVNNYILNYNFYYFLILWILEIVLYILTNCFLIKNSIVFIFKYFRLILIYLGSSIFLFSKNLSDSNNDIYLQYLYYFLIKINIIYIFYVDYNKFLLLMIPFLNLSIIIYSKIQRNETNFNFFHETFILIIMFSSSFLLKKHVFLISLEELINKNYNEYFKKLIQELNTIFIAMNKKDVLFVNDFGLNFFERKFKINLNKDILDKKNDMMASTISIEESNFIDKNSFIRSLFNTLTLQTCSDFFSFVEGKNLNEIIKELLANSESYKNITRLGCFSSHDGLYVFEIFFRKIKYKEEVLEILINDINEIKNKETINSEMKINNKILSKISHEFKTPLISIISLVNNMQTDKNLSFSIKNDLDHITNLANYTILQVNDVTVYVSNSIDLNLFLTKIKIREVLYFCFKILKTLIECNESKSNKIETQIYIDDKVDKLSIITDEMRLKQIMMNLISNAVNFTRSGFIKIYAKYNSKTNTVEITVEDSGVGIKKENYSSIFSEIKESTKEKEFIYHGSGLGLLISKSLSQILNYKIFFESIYGSGTKFILAIESKDSQIEISNLRRNVTQIISKPEVLKTKRKDLLKLNNFNKINKVKTLCNPALKNFESISVIKENNNDLLSPREIEIKSNISSPSNSKIYNRDDNVTKKVNYILPKFRMSDNSIFNESGLYLDIFSFNFMLGEPVDSKKLKIVVVDDQKYVRRNTVNLIKTVLSSLNITNMEIIEGSDGIDLLNIVMKDKTNQIKFIFTDEYMEFLNGSETVGIIRKLEQNMKIPKYHIVSITAFDQEEMKNHILRSGVNSIISKPCSKNAISMILSKEI